MTQYFEDFSVGQKFASGRLTVDAVVELTPLNRTRGGLGHDVLPR